MLKVQKYTPEIYYDQSRDFQFIGRLYDVVLNSVKTNADTIRYGLPFSSQSPQELLTLLSMTLGFKPKHRYSHAQLLAICSVFSEILRNKGNIQAVQLIGEVILKTEGIVGNIACLMLYDPITQKDLPTLRIIVPEKLAEIALFYDLLEYVVPSGCTVEVIRGELLDPIPASVDIDVSDNVTILRDIDGNLVPRNYRLQTPSNSINPIINTTDGLGKKVKDLSRHNISNTFVWRKGNNRK